MDRSLWQRRFEEAERAVAEGQRHITRQKEIIAELERDGHDVKSACNLLAQFEWVQALHIAHRDRLQRELADDVALPLGSCG